MLAGRLALPGGPSCEELRARQSPTCRDGPLAARNVEGRMVRRASRDRCETAREAIAWPGRDRPLAARNGEGRMVRRASRDRCETAREAIAWPGRGRHASGAERGRR